MATSRYAFAPLELRAVERMERPTAGASAKRTVLGIGGSSTGRS